MLNLYKAYAVTTRVLFKMKAREKDKKASVENTANADILANFDIEIYSGPEFKSPKLKMVEEKFRKQAELKAKHSVHH